MRKQSIPYGYFLWTLIFSAPFYLIGELGPGFLPVKLPLSAFMVVAPALAVCTHHSYKKLREITRSSFQLKSSNRMGYLMAILIMPCVMILNFFVMNYAGAELPIPQIAMVDLGVLTVAFFAGAIVEEIGWTGYLTNELLKSYGVVLTGLIIGIAWALWHVIPYFQMGRALDWIIWQFVASVLKRIVMVWLFVKYERSIFITILFHALINLSVFMFPIMGSHYDPFHFCLLFFGFNGVGYFIIQSSYLFKKRKTDPASR